MKKICFALAALTAAFAFHAQQPAAAEPIYPWCSQTESGNQTCIFVSFEQCLAYVSGVGTSCALNLNQPTADAFAMAPAPRSKKAKGMH